MISPMIILPPPDWRGLMRMICVNRHSIDTSDSFTLGGLMQSEGMGVSPERANSSVPGDTSAEAIFIAPANDSETMLTTNSLVDSTLLRVSFSLPSFRTVVANRIVGGLEHTPLKKLNGARFLTPSALT